MQVTTPSSTYSSLYSERLALRPYTAEMAEPFWQVIEANRQRLLPDFPERTTAVVSLQDAQNRIKAFERQRQLGDLYSFGIWTKEPETYIGDITLRRVSRSRLMAEVGYYLASGAEGKGFATEALSTIIAFAFLELGMRSITIKCALQNERSQRIAERCGFIKIPPSIVKPAMPERPILTFRLTADQANINR